MTTITDKLADALRIVRAHADATITKAADPIIAAKAAYETADEALAAYDAQQAGTHGAWRVEDYAVSNGESGVCIKEGDDTVLDLPFMPAWPESTQRARAARIVQCVNAHDGLVSALQFIARGHYTADGCEQRAREALAQAGVRHA